MFRKSFRFFSQDWLKFFTETEPRTMNYLRGMKQETDYHRIVALLKVIPI